MKELLKLMLVGCGLRGRTWARIVKENPTCEIKAYVDISPEALERVRKETGDEEVPGYTDFNDALDKSDVDAAILVTPPQFHFEQSKAIMEKGIHLLAEKPLTEEFETSLELVKIAEKNNLNLTVGMEFRYMPVTQAYKKLFDERKFGDPNFSEFSYIRTRNPMNYKGWVLNQYCNDMAHTFLLEQAIHHLDLIRFVYSTDVEQVQAFEWMNENTPKDALVLAGPDTGLFLPAYTGRRVLYGHPFETVNASDQKQLVLDLLQYDHREVSPNVLADIDLIFAGPREQEILSGISEFSYPVIFETQGVKIYRVIN